jgi:hypothetical protein
VPQLWLQQYSPVAQVLSPQVTGLPPQEGSVGEHCPVAPQNRAMSEFPHCGS